MEDPSPFYSSTTYSRSRKLASLLYSCLPAFVSCYVFSTRNNYWEFLASDSVNMQSVHLPFFRTPFLRKFKSKRLTDISTDKLPIPFYFNNFYNETTMKINPFEPKKNYYNRSTLKKSGDTFNLHIQ